MQRRRDKKGLALVEYAIGLGAVASAAFVSFNYLGFATGEVVEGLTDSFRVDGCYVNVPEPTKWSCRNPFSRNL
jgi:hypothetical protein